MCAEYQKIKFELKYPLSSLRISVAQTKSCTRLEETGGFSSRWQSSRDVHPTESSLAAGHAWVYTHISLSPLFLAKGSSLLAENSSEHFIYILKERERKKRKVNKTEKGGFLSSWEIFRIFTTAETKMHGGVLITSFALNTSFRLFSDR